MQNSDKHSIAIHDILSRIQAWGVTAMFVIPFFWYRRAQPIPNFYGEWTAIFIGLLIVAVWLIRQKNSFLIPKLAFLPIALAFLIGGQLAVMPDIISSQARLGMVYLLLSAALMVAIFNTKPIIKIETLAAALLFGAVLNGCHDWYRIIFENAKKLDALGQRNSYADYLMLGTVSLCYLHARKHFGALVFFLLLTPLIITNAGLSQRSTWLYFIALAIFTAVKTYFAKSRDVRLLHSVLFATTFFVLVTMLMPLIGVQQSSLERLMKSGEAELGSSSRLWIWQSAWKMILDHPWQGVGFGNFDWTYFITKVEYVPDAYWGVVEHAHNIILHLFAELGIVAPLALLVSLVVWLKAQRNVPFDNRNWWLWSCLGVIGIHSLLEYPLWYAFFLGPFTVLLGITAQSSVEIRPSNSFRLLGILLIGVTTLAGGNLLINYTQFENVIGRLTTNPSSVDPKELDAIARRESILRPDIWRIKAGSTTLTAINAKEWLPYLRQINQVKPYPNFVLQEIIALKLTGNIPEAIKLASTLAHTFPERSAEYLANTDILNQIGPDIAATMQNNLPQQ